MMGASFDGVRQGIIGEGRAIETPYGLRRLTYVDHAASGRAYGPIEDYLRNEVLPLYANTHTETTATGAQTTAFREEARQFIKEAVGGGLDDVVIFTGNGVTGAIRHLIDCMGLSIPCCLQDRHGFSIPEHEKPVVFIGSYEHHSVELAFRECEVIVEVVRECGDGGIDTDHLGELLEQHKAHGHRTLLGCFSAASNVTGRLTNVNLVATVMHRHGGSVFFDYAAAGPYTHIDMNLDEDGVFYLDAVFLSMHKFVGGPGTPGILVAKRHLFQNRVPATPGGGTVASVTPAGHTYLTDIEHREEGGTPNIVGSIRAGLAMRLKERIGADAILKHEQDFARRAIDAWRTTPGIEVLGNLDETRLGIVSVVVCTTGGQSVDKCLHHNFVVALLNDLFGIQARGGNSCAAPYAHRLLNVAGADEDAIEACVTAGWHGCKPGWTRLSFGWYDSEATLEFVIEAVQFVARYGWRFLNDYTFNPKSGTWKHRGAVPQLAQLGASTRRGADLPEDVRPFYFRMGYDLAMQPRSPVQVELTAFEGIRWFWLPGELTT